MEVSKLIARYFYWLDTRTNEHALQHYPAVVEVTVELNPIMNLVTTKTVFDPKPVVLTSTEMTKNTSNKPVDVGGRPGLASNSGNANQAARISASPGQESTTDEQQSATQGVTSQTNTTSKHAPLVPINVAAVIGIPSSYYAQLWPTKWRELNPDGKEVPNPTADDLKRIEQEVKLTVTEAVEGVLKDVDLADDKRKNVKVVTHLVGPPIEFPEVTFSETAIAWLGGHWQTLGMFLLGIFGVVTLRRMVRSGPATASAAADVPATELGVASDEPQDDEPETVEARLNQNEFGTGPNLRQELTELVKEDPDAAANILRNWLGDAA